MVASELGSLWIGAYKGLIKRQYCDGTTTRGRVNDNHSHTRVNDNNAATYYTELGAQTKHETHGMRTTSRRLQARTAQHLRPQTRQTLLCPWAWEQNCGCTKLTRNIQQRKKHSRTKGTADAATGMRTPVNDGARSSTWRPTTTRSGCAWWRHTNQTRLTTQPGTECRRGARLTTPWAWGWFAHSSVARWVGEPHRWRRQPLRSRHP